MKNRWSNGNVVKVAATSRPPVTTASSVGAKYLGASSLISAAVRGVISDILIITRLPAANAAAAGRTTRLSGKFHGPMMPTTPSGVGSISARSPSIRKGRNSRAGFIHCATWLLVCSMTGIMPSTSVNNEAGRDRVP